MREEIIKLTPREQLLQMGVPEADIDHHEGDLYVKVTPLSRKWLKSYKFKKYVTVFQSNIEPYDLWYDVPFGYFTERYGRN